MRSGFAFAVPADRHSIPCEPGTCELPDDMTGGKSGLMLLTTTEYHSAYGTYLRGSVSARDLSVQDGMLELLICVEVFECANLL